MTACQAMEGVGHQRKCCLKVVEQLEPKQAAWKWMPTVCLGNYKGTLAVKGQLCWVLGAVQESGNAAAQQEMPRHVLVVPAPTLLEAKQKVVGKSLQQLLHEHVVVPVERYNAKRDGVTQTVLHYAPVWCMTVHKVQGATLSGIVVTLDQQLFAQVLYQQ